MESAICLCIVLAEILCFVQGEIQISTEFMNGDLTFKWNGDIGPDYIKIKLGTRRESEWIQVKNNQYTVKDILKYPNVTITVDEIQPYPSKTYQVSRIDSQEGDTTNLTFAADFIPNSGEYDIYHFYDGTSNRIIRVTSNNESSMNYSKYAYHTRPNTSTNITFEVKNITLMDAGYYGFRTTGIADRSGQGVVLVVKGKPTKPEIAVTLNLIENSDVILTCSSNSTSRPSYYRKTVSLNYIWYRNNTVIDSETRMTLRLPRISRDLRFNKYSCQSKETIMSVKSEEIQINVLYGPSSVTITPQLPVNKTVSVEDGAYIRPYNCSADCNPPCIIKWRYKLSNGTSKEAESNGSSLLRQRVFKDQDKSSFRCVAKSASGKRSHEDIKLYIIYLSKPTVMINGIKEENVDITEGNYPNIVCSVDGKPIPTLSISRNSQENILKTRPSKSIKVLKRAVQCDDTDTYKCTASSPGFPTNHTEVTLNVLCKTRMDTEDGFKTNYGSRSGSGVKVIVKAPIISNPKPTSNLISWSGPTSANIQDEITERGAVIYKHWITSTIPVNDQTYFGNYTMTYNREVIFTITIKAEDIPKPPLNFTGYSYKSGYINLTWISDFNGGPEQFFILSRKDGAAWVEVANITDPGEGDMGHYDPGLLNPGREYWYRLESCNIINCSFRPIEVKVKVQAPSTLSSSSDTVIVIGGAVATAVVLIVVAAILVAIYFLKKKSIQQRRNSMSPTVTVDDSSQPDVVQYAAVDKSFLMRNRKQADIVTDDVIENKNDEQEAVYSNTEESVLISNTGNKNQKKKGGKKTPQNDVEQTTDATYGNTGSRTVNQDGLIYVDVAFTKKPESSKTNGKPVIHGEEDRTEYTFVDFSKKAPPMQETEDDEDTD
ncbi:uncharacterized protein LOC125663395 isoform X1 [Ostrea edulis]|uniref:uncharacterized protein LOC125663395 isoform X1 n=1 Tax=Ostrea edulis TaxID=37623 RepID=UPI0024AF4EB5|nr:uncharacterized protein LOC125663395 isoform X1 [Ostrea edulis]